MFVICQNLRRIIVFIRLPLLAHGDKQHSSAAKTWERIRPTLRDEGTVTTVLKYARQTWSDVRRLTSGIRCAARGRRQAEVFPSHTNACAIGNLAGLGPPRNG
jgi:hypothetical protein